MKWRIVGRKNNAVCLAYSADRGYLGEPSSLRLAAQDVALSRRKQGFESPRERQLNQNLRAFFASFILKIEYPSNKRPRTLVYDDDACGPADIQFDARRMIHLPLGTLTIADIRPWSDDDYRFRFAGGLGISATGLCPRPLGACSEVLLWLVRLATSPRRLSNPFR